MLTKEEVQETISNLKVTPVNHTILVLVPVESDITPGGIIKPEAAMGNEDMDEAFLTVVAVAEEVELAKVGDKVYCQGTITTFSPESIPAELDIAPTGYTIGSVLDMYVKMKI